MAAVYATDAWVVIGPQKTQRQHAGIVGAEGRLDFPCGAGKGLSPRAVMQMSRRPIVGRAVCQQGQCQRQYAAYIELRDEIEAGFAEEDREIERQMREARESLIKLERRLTRVG